MAYCDIMEGVFQRFIHALEHDKKLHDAAMKIHDFAILVQAHQITYGMLSIRPDVNAARPLADGFFYIRELVELANIQRKFELAAYLFNLMQLAHYHHYRVLPPHPRCSSGPTSKIGSGYVPPRQAAAE